METEDKKEVIVATFLNHYGALMLKKSLGGRCSVRAVPRSLSSSCGTCAFVSSSSVQEVAEHSDKELLEGIYIKENNLYRKVYG